MFRCHLVLLSTLPSLCIGHTLHSSPPDDVERALPVMRRESKDVGVPGLVEVDPVEEVQDQLHQATQAARSAASTAKEAAREAVVAAAAPTTTTPGTTPPKASDAFSAESKDKPYRSSVVVNVPAKTTATTTTTASRGTAPVGTTVNIAQMVAAAKAAAEQARDAAAAAARRASAANASVPRAKPHAEEDHPAAPAPAHPKGHPQHKKQSSHDSSVPSTSQHVDLKALEAATRDAAAKALAAGKASADWAIQATTTSTMHTWRTFKIIPTTRRTATAPSTTSATSTSTTTTTYNTNTIPLKIPAKMSPVAAPLKSSTMRPFTAEDIEASAWREIQEHRHVSTTETPTTPAGPTMSVEDTAAAAGRAAERAALASGATKEVAAEAAALAAARTMKELIAKGRFPKPTTPTTTTSSTTSSTTRSTTVATRRPPYYDGPTLSPEDTAAAVGAAAQDHALSTGMNYKEAVALGVQAAAEAMERLIARGHLPSPVKAAKPSVPGSHVAGDVYHPNPPGFDVAPMAMPAASKLPKKMEVHVGAVEPVTSPATDHASVIFPRAAHTTPTTTEVILPFAPPENRSFAKPLPPLPNEVAEQLNLTGWAGHVEVVTSADGRTEIKIDKAPSTTSKKDEDAEVATSTTTAATTSTTTDSTTTFVMVPVQPHAPLTDEGWEEKPGDSPEEALVKQVIHEVTPKDIPSVVQHVVATVLNRSTHDALPRAAGEATVRLVVETPLKDLPEAVVEAIGEVLDRADPQVPEAGDKALDVLRQILRSYRPDPVHSVSQVVDDSLQEAATTTKAPSVERVDVDNSPEDVLKIIEDVAEKLAGKKLPDAVAPGAVASNASRPHEEEEAEEDEQPESNPKLEMQEQINHTQAIEDDDIRIRDDDPGDDTESSSESTEDAKQTAQVDGDTAESSSDDDEATTTEVLESNLVNVTSEADEEPKKMGSGETSPSEDGGPVDTAAEAMKAEADQSEEVEDSKTSHDDSEPMAVHSSHGGADGGPTAVHSSHGGGCERFAVHSSYQGAPSSPTVVKKGASGGDDEDPEEEEAANPGKSGGKVLTTMVTIVGVMLMLVAIGSAGYYTYTMRNRRGQETAPLAANAEAPAAEAAAPAAPAPAEGGEAPPTFSGPPQGGEAPS